MKNKTILILFSLLMMGALLAACGGGETPAPTEAPETMPTEAPPAGPQEVPVTEIQNITWQWVELIENEPAAH